MTDNLLQMLEEKMMTLLSELEVLRRELGNAKQENAALKAAQADHTKKLQGLISLLDALDETVSTPRVVSHELGLVQGVDEYATA